MNLDGVIDKAKDLLKKSEEALKLLLPAVKNFLAQALKIISSQSDRFLSHIPEGKRRPILLCLGGLVALLLILLIATVATHSPKPKGDPSASMALGPHIPPEELFIPAEPDFVPDFLPRREPRQSWSVEDIRPFWRDPSNEDFWREEVKSAVDKLLEGVP
jgi:hypothetical protein